MPYLWEEMAVITSYIRGHLAEYDGNSWVYSDDKTSIGIMRTCARCGEYPTPEGYDTCLGFILGAKWACCGHGIESIKIVWE